jgi:TolB-like protein/DNA-binding winged helix-turn-helix (wHTH) protein/Tfp pilus assembly protein PilF
MKVEEVSESKGLSYSGKAASDVADSGDLLRYGFRLGDWQVHPIEGSIEGPDGIRHLQPKSMDVLLCLAGTPNQIVKRDDLIEQVWGRTAVTDEPLTRCIHEIRRELNDATDHPTYIQTVPKRGYRLIAPVNPDAPSVRNAPEDNRGFLLRDLVSSRYGLELMAVAVAALVTGLVTIGLAMRPGMPDIPLAQELSNIAVIPFDTQGDDETLDWLGNGIAEDLLILLSRVAGLEVAARASSFRPFSAVKDVIEIGQELDVHYVLKGNVQREGEQLWINVRLVDAQTRFLLWDEIYDRRADELFVIQQDIVRQVVSALKLAMPDDLRDQQTVLPDAVLPATPPPTVSIMAYDYYLQARDLLRDPVTPVSLEQAAEFFTRAIDHDAGFSGAYAGLCATIVRQIELRPAGELPADELIVPADAICQKAVELDPESVDGHVAFGALYRVTDRPQQAIDEYSWIIKHAPRTVEAYLGIGTAYADTGAEDKAEWAYRTAIDIKPNDVRTYQAYGELLSKQGRYRELLEIGRRLIQLDPQGITGYAALGRASFLSGQFTAAIAAYREVIRREPTAAAYVEIGASLYYLGRYRAATQTLRLASQLDPQDHRIWGRLGDVYLQTEGGSQRAADMYSIARELAEEGLEVGVDDPLTRIELAYYCAALGDDSCAVRHSAKALDRAPEAPIVRYINARVQLRLGDKVAAVREAERALDLGYPRALFRVDPLLVAVRGSPRLAGILIAERNSARNRLISARLSAVVQ